MKRRTRSSMRPAATSPRTVSACGRRSSAPFPWKTTCALWNCIRDTTADKCPADTEREKNALLWRTDERLAERIRRVFKERVTNGWKKYYWFPGKSGWLLVRSDERGRLEQHSHQPVARTLGFPGGSLHSWLARCAARIERILRRSSNCWNRLFPADGCQLVAGRFR